MLTVVENQKPALGSEDSHKPLGQIGIRFFLNAYCPSRRCPQQGRIRYAARVNKVDSIGELWCYRHRFLNGEAGLADSPSADEGHQPVVRDQPRDVCEFALTPDQPCQRSR